MTTMDSSALRRRYVVLTALTWLPVGLTLAVGVLMMTSRGLGLAEVGLVFVIHSVVVTVLELPTGGIADLIGRRGVLAVSAATGAVALVWIAMATTLWEFIAITVLRGIARALSSGPAEAWYVDAVHATDPDAPIRGGLAAGEATGSIVLGIGTILGGLMPIVFPPTGNGLLVPLSIPMLVAAGCYLALLLTALLGMPEPSRSGPTPRLLALIREVPSTIADGIRLGFRSRVLAHVFATVAVVGVALNTVELFTPVRIEELTGDATGAATVYGVITAVGFAGSALGATLSGRLADALGSVVRTAVTGIGIAATGLILLCASGSMTGAAGLVATAFGYSVMFAGIGFVGPVRSEIIHRQVTSRQRATVVSVQSLVLQGGGASAALVLPWLAPIITIQGVWAVSGVLLAASALMYLRVRADFTNTVGVAP
ncbi:MFS transporter [Stackebrandtia soli]|uniref:MFS transporter n=1 Tax=Stackebrandtia soli TaxID=1892856 RepID=UPI0039EC2447